MKSCNNEVRYAAFQQIYSYTKLSLPLSRPAFHRIALVHTMTGMSMVNPDYRDFYSGWVGLHVLHHAAKEPIFGRGRIEELSRHGYQISPGTLYPLLHGLEQKGYLNAVEVRQGKSLRRVYRATPLGRKALELAKEKIGELFRELIEGK